MWNDTGSLQSGDELQSKQQVTHTHGQTHKYVYIHIEHTNGYTDYNILRNPSGYALAYHVDTPETNKGYTHQVTAQWNHSYILLIQISIFMTNHDNLTTIKRIT